MAIFKVLPGLQVTIHSKSENKELPEYPDEGEWTSSRLNDLSGENRTSSYVECVIDTEFRICLEYDLSF